MLGKGKVMSYEDILEVQRKRNEMEAADVGRQGRGRKRKNSVPAPAPWRGQNSRAVEVEEARCEVTALGLGSFCSVF